jgi:hypothetical protein
LPVLLRTFSAFVLCCLVFASFATPALADSPTPSPTPRTSPTGTPASPSPSPSGSPTGKPTATPTPTATPGPCTFSIPPTNINSGYFVGITVTAEGRPIVATWTTSTVGGSINIYIYPGPPSTYFAGDTNPTSKNTSPPSGDIANGATTANSLTVQTPGAVRAGSYTIYFFKQGVALSDTTSGTLSFAGSQCPS